MDNQLPGGFDAEALAKARVYSPLTDGNPYEVGKRNGFYDGFVSCSAEFHAARTLLEKFISRHESCFVVDMKLFTEIKTFLDGTK